MDLVNMINPKVQMTVYQENNLVIDVTIDIINTRDWLGLLCIIYKEAGQSDITGLIATALQAPNGFTTGTSGPFKVDICFYDEVKP